MSGKRYKNKWGRAGGIILPALYLLGLLISGDPDYFLFLIGPFGIVFWLIQWVGFLLGGWIVAAILTVISLGILGFILGSVLQFLARIVTAKK